MISKAFVTTVQYRTPVPTVLLLRLEPTAGAKGISKARSRPKKGQLRNTVKKFKIFTLQNLCLKLI